MAGFPVLWSSLWPFSEPCPAPVCIIFFGVFFFCPAGTKMEHDIPIFVAWQHWVERGSDFFNLCWWFLFDGTQNLLIFLCHSSTLFTPVELVHQNPSSLFYRAAPQVGKSQLVLHSWIMFSLGQYLIFVFAEIKPQAILYFPHRVLNGLISI